MKFDSSGNFDEVLHTTVSAKPYIFFWIESAMLQMCKKKW